MNRASKSLTMTDNQEIRCPITGRKLKSNGPKHLKLIEWGYPNLRIDDLIVAIKKSIKDGKFTDPITRQKYDVNSTRYKGFMDLKKKKSPNDTPK